MRMPGKDFPRNKRSSENHNGEATSENDVYRGIMWYGISGAGAQALFRYLWKG